MRMQDSSNHTKKSNMQHENLQHATVQSTPNRRFHGRLSRKARLGILGTTLLVAGAMGASALNYLAPKSPNRAKGVTARLVWYVQDGRLRADMHTLASVIEYIVASDSKLSSAAVPTNLPVAGNVTPTSRKS